MARLEISDVSVIVVFADSDVEGGHERLYSAIASKLGHTDLVLVWQDAYGRARFIAPVEQHRFFETIKYDQLLAHATETIALMQS